MWHWKNSALADRDVPRNEAEYRVSKLVRVSFANLDLLAVRTLYSTFYFNKYV